MALTGSEVTFQVFVKICVSFKGCKEGTFVERGVGVQLLQIIFPVFFSSFFCFFLNT